MTAPDVEVVRMILHARPLVQYDVFMRVYDLPDHTIVQGGGAWLINKWLRAHVSQHTSIITSAAVANDLPVVRCDQMRQASVRKYIQQDIGDTI